MSVAIQALVQCCQNWLEPERFQDYCPNGLQVEGKQEVQRLVSGVTASQALIDAAIAANADAILVHHGYFWKGEASVITGIKKTRLQTLLHHNINLLAYHLPLDYHPQWGNNVTLAQALNWPVDNECVAQAGIYCTQLTASVSLAQIAQQIQQVLKRVPQVIAGGQHSISKVAWCTGAAQGYIEQAHHQGAHVFVSGEISEQTVHFAREAGIHYIAAGHHATERYGVQALGARLAEKYAIKHQFIDIDNPV